MRRIVSNREIPVVRLSPNRVGVKVADLDAWVASRTMPVQRWSERRR